MTMMNSAALEEEHVKPTPMFYFGDMKIVPANEDMTALIDADVLLYQMGALSNDEGHPLAWNLVRMRVEERIDFIVNGAECTDYRLYLTGSNNFRIKEATILPYKGNRTSAKPYWHGKIKEMFLESKKYKDKTVFSDDYEADDAMSMALYKDVKAAEKGSLHASYDQIHVYSEELYRTVLCSIDKDLDMCPGHHGKWYKDKKGKIAFKKYTVTEDEGIWWFFRQLLTGDMTDNIPGLYLVGEVAAKRALKGLTSHQDLYDAVQKRYEQRFGSYWKMFMHENARLLWMLRTEDDDIRSNLEGLEGNRQAAIQEKELEDGY